MFAGVGLFLVVLSCVDARPQGYSGGQYYTASTAAAQQPQYISAPQTFYETSPQHQQYAQPQPPTARVSQVLLPSSADRQVQKAAEQIAGPHYAQQVRLAQQEGLAQRAIDAARARAQHQLRRAQQQAQQQAQQPQQYVEAVPSQQQYVQQPQQYQIQYQPEYQQQKPQRIAAQQQRQRPSLLEKQQEEEHDNDASYQFGFDVKDDLYTNYQNRKEQREGGKISGSYSVVDSDGFIRTVTYTADPKEGFKAEVVRQPTDIVVKIPKPRPQPEDGQQYIQEVPVQRYQAEPHHHQQQQQHKSNVVYQYQ